MANGDDQVQTETDQSITQSSILGGLPSAAPKAELVKPPPPPQTEEDKQRSSFDQQRVERYNREQNEAEKYRKIREDYYNKILSIKNQANPELPKLEKELPMPGSEQDPNRNKQNVGQIFGQVLALATIASVVFGRRHGQWGRAIQQQGIGEFLKAYAAGQHEQARDQLINWQKANEAIKEENRQRIQDYKDALSDRHLTLAEQHEVIAEMSQSRQDEKMFAAASAKDLAGILKELDNKSKADVQNSKAALRILETVKKEYFTKADVKSWVDGVREVTKGKLDPTASPEALREAEQAYPMSKWIDETTKEKKFKLSPGTKKAPDGSTLATDTPLTPQQAKDNLKSGDWFEGTNGKFYQIP